MRCAADFSRHGQRHPNRSSSQCLLVLPANSRIRPVPGIGRVDFCGHFAALAVVDPRHSSAGLGHQRRRVTGSNAVFQNGRVNPARENVVVRGLGGAMCRRPTFASLRRHLCASPENGSSTTRLATRYCAFTRSGWWSAMPGCYVRRQAEPGACLSGLVHRQVRRLGAAASFHKLRPLGACRGCESPAANRPQRSIFHRLLVP